MFNPGTVPVETPLSGYPGRPDEGSPRRYIAIKLFCAILKGAIPRRRKRFSVFAVKNNVGTWEEEK